MIEFTTKLFAAGLIAWMGALLLLLAVYAKRGGIHLSGLLAHSQNRIGEVVPERAINVAVFPLIVGYYVLQALHGDVTGGARPSLPDVPESLLVALTGANGLFLAGKIARGPGGDG